MNLINKFVIGLAQSDPNYGINKKNNFNHVFNLANKYGFTFFDTAEKYKHSENYLKKIINKKTIKVTSKLSFEGELNKNLKKEVQESLNDLLAKNGLSSIYGILIHDPLLPLNHNKWPTIYKALLKLKKKKIITKIGVSVYSRFELDQILKIFTPDIIQFPLNVFDQSFNDMKYLKLLKDKKIELHARSIFLQGILLKNFKKHKFFIKWEDNFQKWNNFLKVNKLSRLNACLKFLLQNHLIDKIVIGLGNHKHFNAFVSELKILNKGSNKYCDFSKLNCDDKILRDPRYWNTDSEISNKYHNDWIKVKKNILNGSMLLSKRPEQFIPGAWPTFYKKAKECFIWDNLNNKYLDFSLMGIGTNILGYANSSVNAYVKKAIDEGSTSTLNSNYDYELSKILIKMHPWSEMVAYSRTGAEANAIAIRIARAYSGKDEVAICGYHGWHDWYLSTNLKNPKNLKTIHLDGLSTIGIPKKLKGLTHPFKYNDINSFRNIIKNNPGIGTVFMEVERNEKPKKNFLKRIREITSKKKIVLIFDECSSGFREVYGGLHKKYKVNPDMAVFGKSLGNGIPITAVIGSKNIMESALDSFISSTFWTDATGPAAAISTLKEMKKLKSWKKISLIGKKIKKYWKYLAKKHKINIDISGIDAMPSFKFDHELNLYLRTFMTQECLKKGILATNTIYCCIYHEKYLQIYFKELDKIFAEINKFLKNKSISKKLEFPVSIPGFSRLN